MPTPHPDFARIFHVLRDATLLRPWSGKALRAAPPRWVSRPYRFSGCGALLGGGRWNCSRLFPAVYFATSLDTLNAEADAWALRSGFEIQDLAPLTRFTVEISTEAILDLTEASILSALDIELDKLTRCDWRTEQAANLEALSQAIGRAAYENLAEGLVVPSAQLEGGTNIVLFPGHRRPRSHVATFHEGSLPFVHGL